MGRFICVSDLLFMMLLSDIKIFKLGDSYSDDDCYYSGVGNGIPTGSPVLSFNVSSIGSRVFDGRSYLVLRVW